MAALTLSLMSSRYTVTNSRSDSHECNFHLNFYFYDISAKNDFHESRRALKKFTDTLDKKSVKSEYYAVDEKCWNR